MIQLVVNSTLNLHCNSILTPLLNSTYQQDEIWVHKLYFLNPSFYHPHITQISSKYYTDITQISSRYHQDINLEKNRVLTQIWNDYCWWKLHFETRLKLHFWKAKGKSRVLIDFNSSFWLLGSDRPEQIIKSNLFHEQEAPGGHQEVMQEAR